MSIVLLSFEEALAKANNGNKHLLLGNGFSIAYRKEMFQYNSLFERADFSKLNPNIKDAFQALKTRDFEIVMRALKEASTLIALYNSVDTKISNQMLEDAVALKEVLVHAIADNHPANSFEIEDKEFESCSKFLSHFEKVYTLNYDLLLYWTFMHAEKLRSDDGFRNPETDEDYVTWHIENTNNQNLYYLHGALHIFDTGSELKKYTWSRTGISLIEQIKHALDNDYYPLIVAEGQREEKEVRISHSAYLQRGQKSLSSIGGNLFIYGHSLAENDNHILSLIAKSKISKLFVSLYGDVSSPENTVIINNANALLKKKNKIELYFYCAKSANVWRQPE